MATKARPKVGDHRWFVEWCSKLAFYEECPGEVDRDRCEMSRRSFPTREAAWAFAKEVWPATTQTFGIVEVWEAEFTPYDEDDAARYPHVGYWDAVDEYGEVYEGPEKAA